MKKFLLLASAALIGSGAMVAEEIDVTPKNYHFNEATALPIFNHGVHGANIQGITSTNDITAPIWENINGDEQYNNGLLVIGGGQYWNHENGYYDNVVNGLQLVDLGGEVGKVLAWVGADMDINQVLKDATGEDYNITAKCTGSLNWGNLNFFTDPKNTPTKQDGFIRTTITYQVVAPVVDGVVAAGNAVNNVQFKTNENGMTAYANTAWNAPQNFGYDEDEEEDVYDPSCWIEYTLEGYCPDTETDDAGAPVGNNYFPMRATLNFPGDIAGNIAFFIKDITFTLVTEGEPVHAAGAVGTDALMVKKTYNMGTPAGLKDIVADKNFTFSVNGNTVTFSANAEVYSIAGAKVADAAATKGVNLPAGLYVARVGEKAQKFVVK
ncbi:MAG: hypothetical protein K2M12_07795 [Muribaculaceae bacterium]|nr:hypothetical protein [Muribaculaceae bacterium]